jgi:hypothetical protein
MKHWRRLYEQRLFEARELQRLTLHEGAHAAIHHVLGDEISRVAVGRGLSDDASLDAKNWRRRAREGD